MAGIGPVAGFEQHGVERANFDDFAGHAVDFHPIAQANSIFSHQHKPADEANDEILESYRETRAGKPEKRTELSWQTENHQEYEKHGSHLYGHASDGVKRLYLAAVHRQAANNLVHQRAEVHAHQENRQNNEDSPQRLAHVRALPRGHNADPLPVAIRQLFVRVDTLVVGRQGLLVEGNLLRFLEQCAIFEIHRRPRISGGRRFGFFGMVRELRRR